jgi:N-carbamoyl-L-amino-acid hydrolase
MLAEHMRDCGADVEAVRARKASLQAQDIGAWVEVHIEQAPQLIEAGLPAAIGTGVPGNFRYPEIEIKGEWAHVGLPRRFRHDTVLAASDFALGLDEIWKEADAACKPMAFTIGRFFTDTKEHAMTKVAGRMSLSLNVRAYDRGDLDALEAKVKQLVIAVEKKRGVRIDLGRRTSAEVALSDPALYAELTKPRPPRGSIRCRSPAPPPTMRRHSRWLVCQRACCLYAIPTAATIRTRRWIFPISWMAQLFSPSGLCGALRFEAAHRGSHWLSRAG